MKRRYFAKQNYGRVENREAVFVGEVDGRRHAVAEGGDRTLTERSEDLSRVHDRCREAAEGGNENWAREGPVFVENREAVFVVEFSSRSRFSGVG